VNLSMILNKSEEAEAEAEIEGLELVSSEVSTWYPGVPAFYGPSSRAVLIAGQIDDNVVNSVISQMLELQADDPEAPIRVFVNTVGGDASGGFALYDWMRCLTTPVIGITYGLCSSAGLPILMGADLRLATPRTRFFYHEVVYGGSYSSREESADHMANYDWYQTQMEEILQERAKINKTQWKKLFQNKTSWHFEAEQALALEIVHDLIEQNDTIVELGGKKYGKSRKRR